MTNAEIVAAIIAGISTIATALAGLAAFRSARTAEAAQQALIDGQLNSGRLVVAQLVSECTSAHSRILFLARTLRVLDMTLGVFSGGVGGSRAALMETGVAKLLAKAEEIFKPASTYAFDPVAVGKLIPEDVDRLQLDLTMALAELRSIGDELARDSDSREAQVLQHRAQAIRPSRPGP